MMKKLQDSHPIVMADDDADDVYSRKRLGIVRAAHSHLGLFAMEKNY